MTESAESPPPPGFHYLGEPSSINEKTGLPTIPLRRTPKGPNGAGLTLVDTYRDLYCVISDDKWLCCDGCVHNNPSKGIKMSVLNGKTKFSKFLGHLKSAHKELLVEKDMRPEMYASKKRSSETMMGFVTSTAAVVQNDSQKPRHESHKMSAMKVRILESAVKDICHERHPIKCKAHLSV